MDEDNLNCASAQFHCLFRFLLIHFVSSSYFFGIFCMCKCVYGSVCLRWISFRSVHKIMYAYYLPASITKSNGFKIVESNFSCVMCCKHLIKVCIHSRIHRVLLALLLQMHGIEAKLKSKKALCRNKECQAHNTLLDSFNATIALIQAWSKQKKAAHCICMYICSIRRKYYRQCLMHLQARVRIQRCTDVHCLHLYPEYVCGHFMILMLCNENFLIKLKFASVKV